MSRVSQPAHQTALGSCLRAQLACFRWYDRYDKLGICVLKSLCSDLPDGSHYMITGRHDEIRYTSMSKMRDSQLVYIIHVATETGNFA